MPSFSLETKTKKKKKKMTIVVIFFSSKIKKIMQRREGAYLSSLTSTFGMRCSSCLLLSIFLQLLHLG
jgi:hypothetical protein